MAKFDPAYDKTLGHEGGYANDSKDRGGETFMGVARNFHPGWAGWPIVDAAKSRDSFPRNLSSNADLVAAVRAFYKVHFWDRMCGDLIPSQAVAEEMFDTGVNMGLKVPIEFLQRSLNALSRSGALFEPVEVDGQLGPRTIAAMRAVEREGESDLLYKMLNVLQGARYLGIIEKNPSQSKYCRGWFKRVEFRS